MSNELQCSRPPARKLVEQPSLFAFAEKGGEVEKKVEAHAAKAKADVKLSEERKEKPDVVARLQARTRPVETAESMAARQREISVSEFFTKNRHLLGFDNPRKALLTAIKEAVDNSLDACEEAGILPEVLVEIKEVGEDRFRVRVRDNGPGIPKKQIPNVFAKLLYGSKFHRLKMSRGQQGIGISAAGMYGVLTTGKPVAIISRTDAKKTAYCCELQINTKLNKPDVLKEEERDWEQPHGTEVTIELAGKYQRGRQSVDEYLRQTVIANPHVQINYRAPDGQEQIFGRTSERLPPPTREIKPHPYGIELGFLQAMLRDTKARTLAGFLQSEFSRVSSRVAEEICRHAGLRPEGSPHRLSRDDVEKLMAGIAKTKIMTPPTDCVAPIGEEQLIKGLQAVVPADFYAAATRPPAVYRGNPFIIEAALAWGCAPNGNGAEGAGEPSTAPSNDAGGEAPARLLRFANRVPLLYQQGACCAYQAAVEVNWRNYSLSQPRGALPIGPLTLVVHMASVWVPFTSESKEAIAEYPEIMEEMIRALQECGRKLKIFLSHRRREMEAQRKLSYIEMYIPHIGIGLRSLLELDDKDEKTVVAKLTDMLKRARD